MMTRTVIFGTRTKIFCVLVAVVLCTFSPSFGDTMVRYDTAMGSFHVQLSDTAPSTVANFLNYVADGDYVNSFFHRLMSGFILQGGGFTYDGGSIADIPSDPAVENEFNVSNTYGTIAMAKLGGDPDSATNQFFFNLGDNSANLDNQNGGFTVFGVVVGNGMDVVELLASQEDYDKSRDPQGNYVFPFNNIPLISYQGEPEWEDNLEMVYAVTVVISGDANGDGVVSAGDYAAVQANFGATGDVGIPGDANFDGVVDENDYAAVTAGFGDTSAAAAARDSNIIPEPATLVLLTVGGLTMLRRKNRR